MLFAIPIPLYSKHIYKMKTNLLLLAAFLMFVSCDKEDVNTIPADIYGSYHGTQSCDPTYNGNPIVTVSENDNESIKLSKLALVAHPIIVQCDGSELRIEPQTFPNGGWAGGTVTITGTGDYSTNFISLDVNIH